MDLNSLIQTLVFMNIKDISTMSYRELFPIFMFCICQSYKDQIFSYLQRYRYKEPYKSQISNDIIFYSEEDNSRPYARTTDTTNAILWKYVNSLNYKGNNVKEYQLNLPVELDNKNNFLADTYIPDDSVTIELEKDIYLEFIHSEKTQNKGKDTTVELKIISLVLKSKTIDIVTLQKWLKDLNNKYIEWKDNINSSLKIYTIDTGDRDIDYFSFSSYNFSSTKTFENMFFEHKELIIDRLKQYENIDKYKKLGIPHTLGLLFHGEPGCGKTSCIKAIANYLKRSIISIDLKNITSINHLRELFLDDQVDGRIYLKKEKRIYVFEEIDCTNESQNPFLDRALKKEKKEKIKVEEEYEDDDDDDGRRKPKKTILDIEDRINTGEVLELLDGIAETDDRIIIFTTNHPEKIDKAFMRPGRIDMCIEFKKLRRVDIKNLYKLWFGKEVEESILTQIEDYSISQAEFGKLCFENNAEKVLEILINKV